MSDTGWNDRGTPARVLASLRGKPVETRVRAKPVVDDDRRRVNHENTTMVHASWRMRTAYALGAHSGYVTGTVTLK